jgi:hypothetical protein
MKEPTYSQAIAHAWKAVWKNHILWIFGLFAIFLGQFGFSDILGKMWSLSEGGWGDNAWSFMGYLSGWSDGGVWSVIGIIWAAGIVVCFLFAAIFLSATSQGALISYTSEWYKNNGYDNVAKSWKKGLANFWRILGINIGRKIVLFVLIIGLGWTVKYLFLSGKIWENFVYAILMSVMLLVALFVSVISIYTTCYSVLDGKGLWSALKKSFALFGEHVFVSLEVGVLLMLMNFVLLAVIAAGSFLAFIPSLLVWLVAGLTNYTALITIGLFIGMALWIIFVAMAAAMFNAFTTSVWVYLFLKMHKEGIASRLFHWIKNLF